MKCQKINLKIMNFFFFQLFLLKVYSWTIADELLQQKRDLYSCYFAAQTMRSKIQNSFHELPSSSHESLRDALLIHLSRIRIDTDKKIVNQLCLAIADLSLLMSSWENPILSLIEKLSNDINTLWPLLIIITQIPEEINSRYLRLGANRREEILKELKSNSHIITEFFVACLQNIQNYPDIQLDVMKAFTSLISVHAIDVVDIYDNAIIKHAFNILGEGNTEQKYHDVAIDLLCTVVQCLENNNNQETIGNQIFHCVVNLECAYHMSVAHEDADKAINYCRLFTALSESYLEKMVMESEAGPHYSIKSLDLVLNCVGHYDYEVAEITFNLWFKLSEDLYNKNCPAITDHFKPYIERLIGALYRHAQIDSDHEGLIDDSDSFYVSFCNFNYFFFQIMNIV